MTLLAEAGTFTEKLTTGDQTVTLADSGITPKVIIIWSCNLLSDSTSATNSGMFGIWADDSNAQAVMEWMDNDAAATMDTARRFDGAKVIQFTGSGGGASTSLGQATVASVTAGSFTLTWSTVQGDARYFNYLVLGGTDITAQDLNIFTCRTTNGAQSHNIGFQPDCLIVFGSGGTANPQGTVNHMLTLGAYDGTTQIALGAASLNAAADATTQCRFASSRFIDLVQNDAAVITATVAITANGYDITYSATDGNARYFNVLALKGIRATVFNTTTPTSASTLNVTGAAAQPKGVLLFSAGNNNTNIANSIAMCIGALAGASQQTCVSWTSTDAATTSVTDRRQELDTAFEVPAQNGGSPTEQATSGGTTATGFDLVFSAAATAQNFGGIMFVPAASGRRKELSLLGVGA